MSVKGFYVAVHCPLTCMIEMPVEWRRDADLIKYSVNILADDFH